MKLTRERLEILKKAETTKLDSKIAEGAKIITEIETILADKFTKTVIYNIPEFYGYKYIGFIVGVSDLNGDSSPGLFLVSSYDDIGSKELVIARGFRSLTQQCKLHMLKHLPYFLNFAINLLEAK